MLENEDSHKSCVRVEDALNRCERAGDSQKSSVRADGCKKSEDSHKSWVRVEDAQKSVRFAESQTSCEKRSCVGMRKNDGVEITANDQGNRRCHDADVTPIVRDLLDDDKIPIEEEQGLSLFHMSLPSPRK